MKTVNSCALCVQQMEVAMRNIVSLILAATIAIGSLASAATAGDRYYHDRHQQDREAQALVGAGFAILGLAIIAGSQQRSAPSRHYRQQRWQQPAPRYYAPQRRRCPDLGNYQGRLGYDPRSGCYYPD